MHLKKKDDQIKREKLAKMEDEKKFKMMPVVICDSFIYPGMKTIMTVDTRQLRDMVHIVTSVENA